MTPVQNQNPAPAWWNRDWLRGALLVIVVLIAYLPAWKGQPLWDDDGHITKPELRSWSGLNRIWSETGATQQYYPLVHTVFWVEHRLWGDWPVGYHLATILMHALGALLLLKVLQQLRVPGAWLAAALFALHPVQVESVAWISELKNTLSGVFYFATALAYLRFDQTRARNTYIVALLLFLAGLAAKTVVATLPAAILVVLWWQRGRISLTRDVRPLAPFFIIGMLGGLFTALVERRFIGAQGHDFDFSLLDRVLIAGRAVWFYIEKLVWPHPLIFIYPRWHIDPHAAWQYLFPLAALAALAVLVLLARRNRAPLAAALFFVITLFPALGFFNVFPFMYSFVADHFQYLAAAGLLTLAAAAFTRWLDARPRHIKTAGHVAAMLLLLGLAVLTARQSRMYANEETLWRTTLQRNPDCFMAHNNLAEMFFTKGQLDDAIAEIQKALAAKPDAAKARYNLGNFLLRKGRVDDAIAELQKAVELSPRDVTAINCLGSAYVRKRDASAALEQFNKALAIDPGSTEARIRLGGLYLQTGHPEQALRELQQATKLRPGDAAAWRSLGEALLQLQRPDDAIPHLQKAAALAPAADTFGSLGNALSQKGDVNGAVAAFEKASQLQPDNPLFHHNLGAMRMEKGEFAGARHELELSLKLGLDSPETYNDLAWLLATCPDVKVRDGAQAVILAQHAVDATSGQEPVCLATLAAAKAEIGQYDIASGLVRQALNLAAGHGDSALTADLQAQLDLYQAGKPFRETARRP